MLLNSLLRAALLLGFSSAAVLSNRAAASNSSANPVTWDEHSIFVNGNRLLFFSGEFHPFRLPVPTLWLDIFQKLKSAGYTGVSFYVDWALLEGKPGDFTAEGVFALEPFFEAAQTAGIYLLARPGPYINAEVSGGGFPGWLGRYSAVDRTTQYLNLTQNYITNVGGIISKAQITNGGPVILFQPENEYSEFVSGPNGFSKQYFADVQDQWRASGFNVPSIVNDASPAGRFAPGTGLGATDIYGHDGYPLGFNCANPENWPNGDLPTDYLQLHRQQSPSTPYSLVEFQGGSFDPWGGVGWTKCVELLNANFERVFYKNNYAAGVTIQNLYMAYGGTNWGNLGHPGGYSSYDYGAAISEDRGIAREKYSEIKLQAYFLQSSPQYLTAAPQNGSVAGAYVSTSAISTARLIGNSTNFFIVRQTQYNSFDTVTYKLTLPTSKGTLSIPQLNNSSLALYGRDSKFHVTDYDLAGINLLYSTGEILTWKNYGNRTVLLLYGDQGQTHEFALTGLVQSTLVSGSPFTSVQRNGTTIVQWQVPSAETVLKFNNGLVVYLMSRQDAYNYWNIQVPATAGTKCKQASGPQSVVVKAGYLVRTATISGNTLQLVGDLNSTVPFSLVSAPTNVNTASFNGEAISLSQDAAGTRHGILTFVKPTYTLPTMSSLDWHYIDSLPELRKNYNDQLWTKADAKSNNTYQPPATPFSLYGSDYGYNTGILVFRAHFVATGTEKTFNISTAGGTAFAASVWLNETSTGGNPGNSALDTLNLTTSLPTLTKGQSYVLTVVTDNMGLTEDYDVGSDTNKQPRGILNFSLDQHSAQSLNWLITGNLHGEDYEDRSRGPLNEGGTFAERQGYHLPGAPIQEWSKQSPLTGISAPGIGFFGATFNLSMPTGYDIPLSFVFSNSTVANYRVQLFVNGWQFGKYVDNIGPQTSYPVPEGILNYRGENYVAMTLWGFDKGGNKLSGFSLQSTAEVMSSFGQVSPVNGSVYAPRAGAY